MSRKVTAEAYKVVRGYIKDFYNEPHRRYHTLNHIDSCLDYASHALQDRGKDMNIELFLAISFHDIIYFPEREDNEAKSDSAFLRFMIDTNFQEEYPTYIIDERHVSTLINLTLSTYKDQIELEKYIEKGSKTLNDSTLMRMADYSIFETENERELYEYEDAIFFEYQQFPLQSYIENRIKFLQELKAINLDFSSNIDKLISYITNKKYKIGVYAGSFNPYHIGHEAIVEQAEKLYDKVIIAQGINADKNNIAVYRVNSYRQYYKYNGLLSNLFSETKKEETLVNSYFKENKIDVTFYLVRGMRTSFDVGYEDTLRNTLWDIDNTIPVNYFFGQSQFSHISSSIIRSLQKSCNKESGEDNLWRRYLPSPYREKDGSTK